MRTSLAILLSAVLLPAIAFAARTPATVSTARALVVASSSSGNAYDAGVSVITTAPVYGDLSAAGGTVVSAGSVEGDALLIGGTVNTRGPIVGDLRAIGGTVTTEAPIGGDLASFGFSVTDASHPQGSVLVGAAEASLMKGATGPVTIYANNVWLSGNFGSDVTIVATGRIGIAASTTIAGSLTYEAPEPASIPSSVVINGGVHYTSASYLPDAGTSRVLAIVGIGLFLFVRVLGALILAGLIAGLFPRLSEAVVARAFSPRIRTVLLTTLLGFGIIVATPVLIILLTLTFVGVGLALLLLILYALLVLLGLLFAGILLGGVFARQILGRTDILWRDGVIGMLALSVIALVPVVGWIAAFLFTMFSTGALLQIFFDFAFSRDGMNGLVY